MPRKNGPYHLEWYIEGKQKFMRRRGRAEDGGHGRTKRWWKEKITEKSEKQ